MCAPDWGDKAVQMALNGDTIETIRKELGEDYWEVWSHVKSVKGTEFASWQGAKKVVTIRLKRLVRERDQDKREELMAQANEAVNYLYNAAKSMRTKVNHARRTLNS